MHLFFFFKSIKHKHSDNLAKGETNIQKCFKHFNSSFEEMVYFQKEKGFVVKAEI